MISNLIEETKKQEKELSSFDLELCTKTKKSVEDQYAPFTLCKDILPVTRWYLVNKKGYQIDICLGDSLDIVEIEQCFDLKNNYRGTIRTIVADLGPKQIRLLTPEKNYYLMGEGNKIFGIYKPLTEPSHLSSAKSLKLLSIVLLMIIVILIICGFMII